MPRLRAKDIPPSTGPTRHTPSTWVCRWPGCPDEGKRFTSPGDPVRAAQRHHLLVHGVLPYDPTAAALARGENPSGERQSHT